MSTADQIKQILGESTKRADAATPGPWNNLGAKVKQDAQGWPMRLLLCDSFEQTIDTSNAKFIAAARTDLPARDRALMVAVAALARSAVHYEPTAGQAALASILAILKGDK